ncbi:hypothetical protein JCM11251_005379 [Rhodosporidiobolus azoricus]
MSDVAPMNTGYSVSVLTTHTDDSQPSLLVAFDNQRYLFNTPEATSRIALQNKVGLRKVGHVFLGDLEQSAGLPGFILSSVEAGNDKIQVVGPEGTDHLLASCRYFTRRDKLSLKVTSPLPAAILGPDEPVLAPPIHADANLIVHSFTLSPSQEKPDAAESMAVDPSPTMGGSVGTVNGLSTSPSLKRKRSSTSPSPPPRAKPAPGGFSRPEASFDPSSPSFNPSHLRDQDASEWRDLVIRDMFRGEAFAPRPTQPPPSPSGRRTPSPAYLAQSLPPLPHSYKPSALSYLVIGPRKRGKFLPEKAKALGVKPGKAYAKLIAGGRVWVRTGTKGDTEAQAKRDAEKKKETKKERSERIKREKAAEDQEDSQDGMGEGRWVEADECMGAGQDASAFLILNIPSPAHLSTLSSTIPVSHFSPTSLPPQTSFRGVFLFLGPSVLSSPSLAAYLASLRSLHPKVTLHVSSADFMDKGKNEIVFAPSSLLNLRLSKLDNEMFRIPHYSFLPSDPVTSSPTSYLPTSLHDLSLAPLTQNSHFTSQLIPLPPSKSPFGNVLRSFDFPVPSVQADAEAARLKGEEKTPEMLARADQAWGEYVEKADEAKEAVKVEEAERQKETQEKGQSERDRIEGELVVTPLGTGSAIPSKYRNVSATLLHLPRTSTSPEAEQEYILLDAGEGTWGQIARRFGQGDEARNEPSKDDVLRGIKFLFISHLHQDHHAGVATILRKRAQLNPPPRDPLTILCPPNARTYLFEQQQLFDLGVYERGDATAEGKNGREVRFLDNFLVEPGKVVKEGSRAAVNLSALKSLLGLTEVVAVPVLHRCRAWGLVATHSSGWKIVFSGDTTPCPALALAGQDASLLVHEATIEDDMPEVAAAKGHSTFGQAVEMAVKMKARHLLLTHFSARYPKLPPLTTYFSQPTSPTTSASPSTTSTESPAPVSPPHRPVVATAFDLLTLPLSSFWKMERYRPAMDALLSWDEGEAEEIGDETGGKEKGAGEETEGGTEGGKKAKGKKEGKGKGKGKKEPSTEEKMGEVDTKMAEEVKA